MTPGAPAQAAAEPDWTYPPQPGRTAADLARSDFFPRLLRPLLHMLVRPLLWLLFRFRAKGRRHVPRRGPFVLVANHNGHADTPALMAAIPLSRVNTAHPLAAQDYFFQRRLTGGLVHLFLNALPIDRTQHAEAALGDGRLLLDDGRGLILFPEGTRSTTGELGPFKKGVGFLVAGTSIPVVPAYIVGSRDILPKGASRPRLARLHVRLGPPAVYATVPTDRDGWAHVAADLEARVRALATEGA
ncbi:MAG: lysophospholipid acyltransferase family protein [Thermoplasmatota archaeon]